MILCTKCLVSLLLTGHFFFQQFGYGRTDSVASERFHDRVLIRIQAYAFHVSVRRGGAIVPHEDLGCGYAAAFEGDCGRLVPEAVKAEGLNLGLCAQVGHQPAALRERLAKMRFAVNLHKHVIYLGRPGIADSLAGRMEVLTLYPLSQGEIAGVQEDFIHPLFQKDFPLKNAGTAAWTKEALLEAIAVGGYPEVLSRNSLKRRAAWFDSYITTLVERDIRDISNVQPAAPARRSLGNAA